MVPSEQHSEEQLKHSEELKQSEELKRFQQLRQEQSECPQTAVHFELLLSLAFVSGKCDLSVFLTWSSFTATKEVSSTIYDTIILNA